MLKKYVWKHRLCPATDDSASSGATIFLHLSDASYKRAMSLY